MNKLSTEFLTFLTLLESETASGELSLSLSDFAMLLYHLRKVSTIITKRDRKMCGEEITVHSVSFKLNMKLMDLGRIPSSVFEQSYQKGEHPSDAERQALKVRESGSRFL